MNDDGDMRYIYNLYHTVCVHVYCLGYVAFIFALEIPWS